MPLIAKRKTIPWQIKAAEITGRYEAGNETPTKLARRFDITSTHAVLLIKLYKGARRHKELMENITVPKAIELLRKLDEKYLLEKVVNGEKNEST